MRTLAATFSTRNEAEAASRRLEAIGVSRDRIILKDVAAAGGAAGDGVFVSVKVTMEQVQPVSEILKSHAAAEGLAAPVATSAGEQTSGPVGGDFAPPFRPLPTTRAEPAPVAPTVGAQQMPGPGKIPRPRDERARIGRQIVLYCLALVAAFVIGAWLGLLS